MKSTQLTKTCLTCGTEKPLTAFLQLTGAEGSSYGSICATCRGTSAESPPVVIEKEEDPSRSSGGFRIGAKEKVFLEKTQKEFLDLKKAREEKADQKKFQLSADMIERSEQREKSEKEHRKNYIEARQKKPFLSSDKKAPPPNRVVDPTIQMQETEATERAEQQQAGAVQEFQKTNVDFANPFVDEHSATIGRQGAAFNTLRTWLGESANMNRTAKNVLSHLYP